MFALKDRPNLKSRYITEINRDNLPYCKELMKIGELRHLDNIKRNFGVSESEYIASTMLEEAKPVSEFIYSNVKATLEQQKYVFETLWDKAIPAEQKIREIEEGVITNYETKVLENHDDIANQVIHLAHTSSGLYIVSVSGGMQLIYNNFFDLYKEVLDGIKWITNIQREDAALVKIFLDLGMQLKHAKNLPPNEFRGWR